MERKNHGDIKKTNYKEEKYDVLICDQPAGCFCSITASHTPLLSMCVCECVFCRSATSLSAHSEAKNKHSSSHYKQSNQYAETAGSILCACARAWLPVRVHVKTVSVNGCNQTWSGGSTSTCLARELTGWVN